METTAKEIYTCEIDLTIVVSPAVTLDHMTSGFVVAYLGPPVLSPLTLQASLCKTSRTT